MTICSLSRVGRRCACMACAFLCLNAHASGRHAVLNVPYTRDMRYSSIVLKTGTLPFNFGDIFRNNKNGAKHLSAYISVTFRSSDKANYYSTGPLPAWGALTQFALSVGGYIPICGTTLTLRKIHSGRYFEYGDEIKRYEERVKRLKASKMPPPPPPPPLPEGGNDTYGAFIELGVTYTRSNQGPLCNVFPAYQGDRARVLFGVVLPDHVAHQYILRVLSLQQDASRRMFARLKLSTLISEDCIVCNTGVNTVTKSVVTAVYHSGQEIAAAGPYHFWLSRIILSSRNQPGMVLITVSKTFGNKGR